MAPADRRQIRLEADTEENHPPDATSAGGGPFAPPRRTSSLSARLLILTIGFVMFAQVAVLAPMMSRARIAYLNQNLNRLTS